MSLPWSARAQLVNRDSMAAEVSEGKVAIPALAVTAYTAKYHKQRKTEGVKKPEKRKWDDKRNKTRINIGTAFQRWRELRDCIGLKLDSELAAYLLDCYEKVTASSSSTKHLSLSSVSQPPSVSERVSSSNETTVTADEGSVMEQVDNKACVSPDRTQTTVCSVKRCDSWRRNVQCFNLPEDPQVRLHWVQFVGQDCQLFKESSFTDITICKEHFFEECFEKPVETDGVQLKPGAVPTIVIKSEDDESIDSLQQEVPVKTEDSVGQCVETFKRVPRKQCPSCDCTFQTEKVADSGTLPQPCLQCGYRDKLIRQINIPPSEHQPGSIEVTIEPEQTDDVVSDSEAFAQSKEESDISDEEEGGDDGDATSDEDWVPQNETVENEKLKTSSEQDSEEEEMNEDEGFSCGQKMKQLCTECGAFYYSTRPHICEHKTRPYVCNVCGKRCVTAISLKIHSYIHNESHEFPCKYCYVTFKTKLDKLAHQQCHQNTKNPYKCPDCPKTFASNKQRRVHLKTHRRPNEFKCDICGIIFWRKGRLLRHMVIHTGIKPFKCSECQRTFNQPGHLKSHMRLHTGEKPYKCQYCDESFNHNVSLKSHIQRYHPFKVGEKTDKNYDGSSDTCDAQEHSDTRADYVDNVDKEQDTEQVPNETVKSKHNRLTSERPVGRPKRNASGKAVETGRRKSMKSAKSLGQNLNNVCDSSNESEEHLTDSDISFDMAQEEDEEEREGAVRKSSCKYKNGSDLECDPGKETKNKKPRRSRGQSLKKCRGRPRKNYDV